MKISLIKPIAFLFTILCLSHCKSNINESPIHIEQFQKVVGNTMGTTYNITYKSSTNYKDQIDSLLLVLNEEVSTYIPNSTISQVNRSIDSYCLDDHDGSNSNNCINCHFINIFKRSKDIFTLTSEYFEPTIMPLVNYWGFGYKTKKPVLKASQDTIDSMLEYIGFDKITLIQDDNPCQNLIIKNDSRTEIDFSAIAKGYGVDLVSEFLSSKGINNYMVEIGGELNCRGKNQKGEYWKIGINTPDENAPLNDFSAIVKLDDLSMASSGNYRIFYQIDSIKYGHEINPKSGYPEINQLLSVTVVANNCMDADAFATAFMVMGLENSKELIESIDDLEGYFIYGDVAGDLSTYQTKGFESLVFSQ